MSWFQEMYLSEITENSKSPRLLLFFWVVQLVGWNLPLQTVYPETKNSTTNRGSICTHSHLLSLMYHFPHLCSLCLHSEGSTNQDGLFLERNKPSKNINSSSKPPSTAGAAVAVRERFCGICANQTNLIWEERKIWFSIFAQLTSGCRDSRCKYLWGCGGWFIQKNINHSLLF